MRKTALLAIVASILIPVAVVAAKKDPIVMTIGNEEVKLSEFEYLYKKNNAQLATDMTIDEYIDMFVNYKLKVCAALDAKLDTLSSYRMDMKKYSSELAEPYRVDQSVLDSLVNAAYSHMTEVVDIHHLMFKHKTASRSEVEQLAFADSIRDLIAAGADFEQMVKQYSVDPAAAHTAGKMTIQGGYLIYELEDAIYNTPVGEVTEVVPSRVGLHVFKVNSRHPHPGEVKIRHLLVSTQNLPEEEHGLAKAKADSLRKVILAGADFKTIASQYTEDPSGRNNGGELPWFGPGRMIKEFETAAYAMKNGEVSEPVKTAFGYHLLLREGGRPVASLDSVKEELMFRIRTDSRYQIATDRVIYRYAKESGSKINAKIYKKVRKILDKQGGLNEASRQKILSLNDVAYIVDGQKYQVSAVSGVVPANNSSDCDSVMTVFEEALKASFMKAVEAQMRATLADREPAYGNLINEYSDGMLLYEISNRCVWDRANTDVEGLEAYYQSNKDAYRWEVPHYKGYVVCAESDSILKPAMAHLATLAADANYETELRKEFGTKVKIERVITARQASPVVDYIAFGGELPKVNRWVAFAAFNGKILDQPESAMDVKGEVGVDYQQFLEEEWIKQLRETYPIVVDRKLIKESIAK